MQNMVVADRAGHIGVVSAGRVPLRKPDNELRAGAVARLGRPATTGPGMLDAGATPREIDPARGWIATANQRIHASDYPHYIGGGWAPPWRYQRIEQMLTAKDKLSLDDMRAMQADTLARRGAACCPAQTGRARSPARRRRAARAGSVRRPHWPNAPRR